MPGGTDLTYGECRSLLTLGEVGRVAVSTPMGPRIVSVNYTVVDDAVIFRAPTYSILGTYARNATLAFEVDRLQVEEREGWSVVAIGRAGLVEDPEQLRRIREAWSPTSWGDGHRSLCFRMPWTELTGRRIGGLVA